MATITKKSGGGEAASADLTDSAESQFRRSWADNAFQYTMAGLLVASVVVMCIISPDFRDPDNLVNILQ